MALEPAIRAHIEECIRAQSRLHRVLSALGVGMSLVLFGVVAFAPMKPDELGAVAGVGVIGAALLAFSVAVFRGTSTRAARIRALLFDAPQQLTSLDVSTVEPSDSSVKMTVLRMSIASGEVITLLVPNEAAGRAIIASVERVRWA